jgi:hypothetical protein
VQSQGLEDGPDDRIPLDQAPDGQVSLHCHLIHRINNSYVKSQGLEDGPDAGVPLHQVLDPGISGKRKLHFHSYNLGDQDQNSKVLVLSISILLNSDPDPGESYQSDQCGSE